MTISEATSFFLSYCWTFRSGKNGATTGRLKSVIVLIKILKFIERLLSNVQNLLEPLDVVTAKQAIPKEI